MKILLAFSQQMHIQGLYNGIIDLGHECLRWIPEQKSIYDVLFEHKPELLIISRYLIQPHYADALKQHNVKSVVVEDLDLQPAANTSEFYRVDYDEKCASDVLYIDLPGSNGLIEMLPYIKALFSLGYKIKIFSQNNLSTPSYLGAINIAESRTLISSTKICLDYNGSCIYDCAAMKTFCLSTQENKLFPSFDSISTCEEQIKHFLSQPKLVKKIIKDAYKVVMDGNTYKDRATQILELAKNEQPTLVTDAFTNLTASS